MKKIEITLSVTCSDRIASQIEGLPHLSAYMMEHLRKNAQVNTHIGKARQLYNVDVSDAPDSLLKSKMLQDSNGLLSDNGIIHTYLKGEAIKKAERFYGKIVEAK